MSKIQLSQGAAATRILGIGSTQPERVVTNDELSTIMDTNDQWIRERVGIAERRFGDEKDTVVSMAVEAGSKAIAAAGLDPADVDTVLVATCSATVPIPNATAQVAELVGVKAGGGFDLNAACAGFCYGLAAASDMVRAGSARRVLVIGSEKLTDVVDPVDRSTAIIFADGAGAAVVARATSRASAQSPGAPPVTSSTRSRCPTAGTSTRRASRSSGGRPRRSPRSRCRRSSWPACSRPTSTC